MLAQDTTNLPNEFNSLVEYFEKIDLSSNMAVRMLDSAIHRLTTFQMNQEQLLSAAEVLCIIASETYAHTDRVFNQDAMMAVLRATQQIVAQPAYMEEARLLREMVDQTLYECARALRKKGFDSAALEVLDIGNSNLDSFIEKPVNFAKCKI